MIYLVTCPDNNTCKIGYSADPNKRVKALSTSSPFDLVLHSTITGEITDEKLLHDKFKEYNLRGEWFKLTTSIVDYFTNYTNDSSLLVNKSEDFLSMYSSLMFILKSVEGPHIDESLMSKLNVTQDKYSSFMKKLYRKGVINYIFGVTNGVEYKYITLTKNFGL